MNKLEANLLAQRLQDAFAQTIKPVHTSFDGDVSFVAATGKLETEFEALAVYSIEVCKEAIRNAVRFAQCVPGVPAYFDFKID